MLANNLQNIAVNYFEFICSILLKSLTWNCSEAVHLLLQTIYLIYRNDEEFTKDHAIAKRMNDSFWNTIISLFFTRKTIKWETLQRVCTNLFALQFKYSEENKLAEWLYKLTFVSSMHTSYFSIIVSNLCTNKELEAHVLRIKRLAELLVGTIEEKRWTALATNLTWTVSWNEVTDSLTK
jgi:hypothetical protein